MPFTKTFNPGEILTASDVNEHLLNGGYQYRETVYFTSSGTFVKADYPWLRAIRVRCVGGGGGGTTDVNISAGGSGGGGGAESFITDIAGLAASVTVTRGAGGAGRTTAGVGNNGTASSFGALVAANGGEAAPDGSAPGQGGAGTAGNLLVSGGPGTSGMRTNQFGDGRSITGNGGNAPFGLGFGGRGLIATSTAGAPGQLYGGGASGAGYSTVSNAGANGIVIVDLFG
jgi:hypothetical protein